MFNPTLPLDTFQNLRNFEMTHHEESSSSSSSHLFYFLPGWHLQLINLLEKMPLAAWNLCNIQGSAHLAAWIKWFIPATSEEVP